MATVTLSIVGNAILPGIGGVIGGVMGSYLDNAVLFPALFSQDITQENTARGPRIDELSIQTGSEGSPIRKVWGRLPILAGSVIWLGELVEEKLVTVTYGESESGGGKGGGGGSTVHTESTVIEYFYFFSVAIAVCHGEINGIDRIWADGKPFHSDLNVDVNISGTNFEAVDGTPEYRLFNYDNAGQGDLRQLQTNENCTITGFTNGANNGTFKVLEKHGYPGDGSTVRLNTGTPAVPEGPPTAGTVTITQTIPSNSGADDVRFYLGTGAQTPDSFIQALEGSANTPAFKHIAYVVFEKLALGEYGNRLPQFRFRVQSAAAAVPYRDVLADILDDAGFASGQYDVTTYLPTTECKGYVVDGPKASAAQIQPLMIAFDLGVREENNKLVFYERGVDEDTPSINSSHLAATEGEMGTLVPEIRIRDRASIKTPKEVTVNFIDTSNQGQRGSVTEINPISTETYTAELNVPVTMSQGFARKIARRRLWSPYQERMAGDIVLSPRYVNLIEGDTIDVTSGGEVYTMRVTRITRGADFVHEIEGVIKGTAEYDHDETSDPFGGTSDPGVYVPPNIKLLLFNIPAIQSGQTELAGFYWALCAADYDAGWRGGGVWASSDDVTFSLLSGGADESTIFRTLTQLGTTTLPECIDYTGTVDIQLLHGSVSTVTRRQMLDGSNRALIQTTNGWELIGFQTVTTIDASLHKYRLSTLLRGLRQTDGYVGDHATDDALGVVLNSGGIEFSQTSVGVIGTTRYYKGVATGADEGDVVSQSFVLGAETLKPFSPCQVRGTWNYTPSDPTTYPLIVTWVRRTRDIARIFGILPLPMLEPVEEYEVELLKKSDQTVSATYTGILATTYTIPDADLVTAGYTPGDDSVYVNVYQISAQIGRGFVRQEIITP